MDRDSSDRGIVVNSRLSDPRIRFLTKPHRGLDAARNIAIRSSRGRYVAFLDPGDMWVPEKLERHVAHLSAAPDVGLSYSYFVQLDASGKHVGWYQTSGKDPTPAANCMIHNPVGGVSNAVLRAGVFAEDRSVGASGHGRVDVFDEGPRCAADLELWARIAATTKWQLACIPWPLTVRLLNPAGRPAGALLQKSHHLSVLTKMYAYAPDLVERHRTTSIAYLYWQFARVLVKERHPVAADNAVACAVRHSPASFCSEAALIGAATLLLSVLPDRLYTECRRVAVYLYRKFQEARMQLLGLSGASKHD